MKTQLQAFQNNDLTANIRCSMNGDDIWFVAGDMAKALDYTRTDAMLQHCDECAVLPQLNKINNLSPATKWINESDLYSCIFRSTKPETKAFKKWVTSEVLPEIRKTGSYQPQQQFDTPKSLSEALRLAADIQDKLEAANAQIEADKPKVEFAMAVRNLDGSCKVEEFAKAIGWGRNKMFSRLRDDAYLQANNQPYQKWIEASYFVLVEQTPFVDRDGISHPCFTTRVTGKGQVALEKKYRKAKESGLVLLQGGVNQ